MGVGLVISSEEEMGSVRRLQDFTEVVRSAARGGPIGDITRSPLDRAAV
jgi:hypothetical protein